MRASWAFIKLGRLKFLLGGFLMFGLGSAYADSINWWHYLAAQVMVMFAQLVANYANEYADFDHDLAIANRTAFSGGSGILTSGSTSPQRSLTWRPGVLCVGVGGGRHCWFVQRGRRHRWFGRSSYCLVLFNAAATTTATGIGEFATSLTVAGLVPLAGLLSQQTQIPGQLWPALFVLICLQFAMLLGFELPDLDTDDQSGKRVLGVRLGQKRTERLMASLVVFAIVVNLSADVTNWSVLALPSALGMFVAFRAHQWEAGTLCAVSTFFSLRR